MNEQTNELMNEWKWESPTKLLSRPCQPEVEVLSSNGKDLRTNSTNNLQLVNLSKFKVYMLKQIFKL